jgi:hypothetical protein
MTVTVKAAWDPEACVWYIEQSNLPGLHIEAETAAELYNKLPEQSKICLKAVENRKFRLNSPRQGV